MCTGVSGYRVMGHVLKQEYTNRIQLLLHLPKNRVLLQKPNFQKGWYVSSVEK